MSFVKNIWLSIFNWSWQSLFLTRWLSSFPFMEFTVYLDLFLPSHSYFFYILLFFIQSLCGLVGEFIHIFFSILLKIINWNFVFFFFQDFDYIYAVKNFNYILLKLLFQISSSSFQITKWLDFSLVLWVSKFVMWCNSWMGG